MKTLEELEAIRDRMQNQLAARHMMEDGNVRIIVGMATCGIAAGARPVLNKLNEEVAERKLQHVTVTQTGCIGLCKFEPVVEVYIPGREKVTYVHVTPEKAVRIIGDHIVNGNVVEEYTIKED